MSIAFITVLLVCQLAGEVLTRLLDTGLPGPVIGMLILFAGLVVRGGVPEGLQHTAQGILQHLSLLFVPAGVGVVTHLRLVGEQWVPITASLIVSTMLTIVVTALVMVWMSRLMGDRPGGDARKED